MKKIATLIALLWSLTSFAQQEAQFSQNMFTHLTVNPAYAGIRHTHCGTLLYRAQWVGFTGAPRTASLNMETYFEDWRSGVGLTVVSDKLGFDKTFLIRGAYSFHFELDENRTLAFGAGAGFMQKSLDGGWVPPQTTNDVAIPNPSIAASAFDAGAGVFYKSSDIYFGLSATQLPQRTFSSGTVDYKNVRHYYLTAGWSTQVAQRLKLTPSLFVKSDAVSTQLDVNLMAELDNRIWGGASYRLTDAVVVMGGVKVGYWKFGYAHDVTTSKIRHHSSNTHEFMIGYCHPIIKNPTIWENVRYAMMN